MIDTPAQSTNAQLRKNETSPARSLRSEGPFFHAPERAQTVFSIWITAAAVPLVAGVVLFGWRVLLVAGISIGSCVFFERLYFRVTRTPALLGRTHAYLTGLLLALTLPPFVPWYVPVVGGIFSAIVAKAMFGGIGHFLWQPALVGRLAVAAIFGSTINPSYWGVLGQDRLLVGDIRQVRMVEDYAGWRGKMVPAGADGFALPPVWTKLAGLTQPGPAAQFSALAYVPADLPAAKPAALAGLPPISDLFYGVTPGGIGETCAVIIAITGLYLVYRGYVGWHLPVAVLAGAWITAAVFPVRLAGPADVVRVVYWPILSEGLDVGFTYVSYQMLAGELVLTAFFLATEMTSRPLTRAGGVLFGLSAGAIGMFLRLRFGLTIPFYIAVLGMNTLTPMIDSLCLRRTSASRWKRRRVRDF